MIKKFSLENLKRPSRRAKHRGRWEVTKIVLGGVRYGNVICNELLKISQIFCVWLKISSSLK
jgi:hypothetical protein